MRMWGKSFTLIKIFQAHIGQSYNTVKLLSAATVTEYENFWFWKQINTIIELVILCMYVNMYIRFLK